jgi:thiol-disulfide isomerase/thioredoxin
VADARLLHRLFQGSASQEYEGGRSFHDLKAFLDKHVDDKKAKAKLWREELGRATWKLMHTMAAKYPNEPTDGDRLGMIGFLDGLRQLYPCETCRAHLKAHLNRMGPYPTQSRAEISQFLCRLHNRVNHDLEKPAFNCSIHNLDKAYVSNCTGCVTDGSVIEVPLPGEESPAQPPAGESSAPVRTDARPPAAQPTVPATQPTATAAATDAIRPPTQPTSGAQQQQRGECRLQYDERVQGDADLRDGSVTIVFFMSATCHVCHEIAPALQTLSEKYGRRGLRVIAVHSDIYGAKMYRELSKVQEFIDEMKVSFTFVTAAATEGDPEAIDTQSTFNQLYLPEERERLENAGHKYRFAIPSAMVVKDCKTVCLTTPLCSAEANWPCACARAQAGWLAGGRAGGRAGACGVVFFLYEPF